MNIGFREEITVKKGFKTSIVLIAGLALALAGCSKNDQPTGTASGSAEPSGSASAAEAACAEDSSARIFMRTPLPCRR